MRFLKNKIEKSAEIKKLFLEKQDSLQTPQETLPKILQEPSPLKDLIKEEPESPYRPTHSPKKTPCENIIKNYSRAMANFALSSLASPYLETILPKHNANLVSFLGYIRKRKRSVNCIKKLRDMLPSEANRDAPNYKEKLVFQDLCIVFVKFFSVNWLFNSKINNKTAHLEYRFKILRRIRDPEHFTYLKDFKFDGK